MIEKILERLGRLYDFADCYEDDYHVGKYSAYKDAIEIVQEVAKEYGYGRKLNRCDTCIHYVTDEVPPICYFCCKGMEDNYVAKE
jgi:hypothetical protein